MNDFEVWCVLVPDEDTKQYPPVMKFFTYGLNAEADARAWAVQYAGSHGGQILVFRAMLVQAYSAGEKVGFNYRDW